MVRRDGRRRFGWLESLKLGENNRAILGRSMASGSDLSLIYNTNLFLACLLSVIALPMAFGRVKPNVIYGFRTKKTLENEDLWYAANRTSGIGLILSGIAFGILSVALNHLSPQLYTSITTIALCLFLGLTIGITWFRHLRD